jgi:hypothetical protein
VIAEIVGEERHTAAITPNMSTNIYFLKVVSTTSNLLQVPPRMARCNGGHLHSLILFTFVMLEILLVGDLVRCSFLSVIMGQKFTPH